MSYIDIEYPTDKKSFYKTLGEQLREYAWSERNAYASMANASAVLKIAFPRANWAGFYLVDGESGELVLGPFQGRPAVTRIGYGCGVCGTAWKEESAQVVEDVECFAGHIACDCNSHSEIVIPLRGGDGKIWGVLDMDSVDEGYFTDADREGLERVTAPLAMRGIG